MKKKFINGLLMVAMIVGATSSLVSCKDYDDEKNANLQEQMFKMFEDQDATLRGLITAQGKMLGQRIDSLRIAFDACKLECGKTKGRLDSLVTVYNLFRSGYDTFYNDVTTNYATKTYVTTVLKNYYTQADVDKFLAAKTDTATFNQFKRDTERRIDNLEQITANWKSLADTNWVNSFFQRKGNYVTKDELDDELLKVLDEALNGSGSGTSIEEIIKNYITQTVDLSEYITGDSILTLISNLTTLTENDVKNIINTYNYLTKEEIEQLIQNFSTLTADSVKAIVDDKLGDYYTKAEVDTLLTRLENKLTLIINNVSAVANAAKELAEENRGLIDGLTTKTANLSDSLKTAYENIDKLNTKTNNLSDSMRVAYQHIANLYDSVAAVKDMATNNYNLIVSLTETTNILRDSVQILDGKINNLEIKTSEIEAKVLRDSVRIVKLQEGYQALKDTLQNFATINYVDQADQKLNERIDSILNNVVPELNTKIQDARDYAETLADSVGNLLSEAVTTLNNTINSKYQEFLDSIAQHRTELNGLRTDVNGMRADLNQAMQDIKDLRDDLDDLTTTVGDLNQAFTDYVAANDARVLAVENRVDKLEKDVEKINEAIEDLKQELQKKVDQDKLAKMITSVTINGTYNPVFGSFNTPVGLRSNVLVAYHGYINDKGAKFEFPTIRPIFFADQTLVDDLGLDEDEALLATARLGDNVSSKTIAPGTIVAKDGAQGNAGKVYMTVNPAEQDFSGVEPMLVTSNNYKLGMELSPIRKSSDKLTFGWTRAASNQTGNGFYEAEATVDLSAVYNGGIRFDLDLSSVKEVISDVKDWRNGVDMSNVVSAVYNNITDIIDASAVKVQYTDEATGQLRALTSDYELASATIRPLSYKTLDGIGGDHVPGIGRVERLINKLFKNVTARLTLPKLNFVIKELNMKDLSLSLGRNGKDYTITYTLEFDKPIDIDIDPITISSDKITVTLPQLEAYSFQTDVDGNFVKYGGGLIAENQVDHIERATDGYYHAYDKNNVDLGRLVQVATTYTETKEVHPDDVIFDPAKQTFTIHVSEGISIAKMNEIVDDFYGQANSQLGKINSQVIDKINEYIHDVCGQLYDLQDFYDSLGGQNGAISGKLGEVKSQIIKYLERFNKRFAHLLTPNSWMQPVMLADTPDHGLRRLSQAKSIPSSVKGSNIKLWATTYNAEILTPAYRKYVVCTKAFDAEGAVNVAERDAFNNCDEQLNTVNFGEWDSIDVTIKKGYTYEVLYMAVDFYGIVTARKYYIKGI